MEISKSNLILKIQGVKNILASLKEGDVFRKISAKECEIYILKSDCCYYNEEDFVIVAKLLMSNGDICALLMR